MSPLPPPSLPLLRLRPMPNHMKRIPTSAAMAMTPTIVTARVDTRMS